MNFDEIKKSKVKFVDDNTLMVEGMGDVIINRKNGSQAIIIGVLFVPVMKCNLLSIGQLVEKGYTVIMGNNDRVELYDRNKKLILTSKISRNRTFQVSLEVVESMQCMVTVKKEENWLWHMRFGHLSFRDLQMLGEKCMVSGTPNISLPGNARESCLTGKQTRKSF